ncbi:YbfB/YjiJ family MFS transporter [Streptomyces sp. NPDC001492]
MSTPSSPRTHVAQAAAALAAGRGVGRLVHTPNLPLMHTQAGLSAGAGAHLATANHAGCLAGALEGIPLPSLVRARTVLRGSLLLLTATLVAMPLTHSTTLWGVLRLLAGAVSALVFVVAAIPPAPSARAPGAPARLGHRRCRRR